MNVSSLQIILNEKSLIIKLLSLKIHYKKTKAQRSTQISLLQKKEKGGCLKRIFQAKHENEVEVHRREKLPSSKNVNLSIAQGIKILLKTTSGSKENPNSFGT